jgi:hypothetical protein
MGEPTRRWTDVLADEPVNHARAAIYERLMEAQERIAQECHERGIDDAVIRAALDQADEELSEDDRREDLYLASLVHYVRALGGQIEVRALFGDRAVAIRRAPDDGQPSTTAR